MPAPVIRVARAEDVPAMARIERASFGDPWSEAAFRSLMVQPTSRVTVAVRGGAIAGYAIAITTGEEAELANLAVDPEVRRAGLGAALLDELLTELGSRCTVYLEVREGNAAARALYASRGFAETGRRKAYYAAPREDAILMTRPARK